MDRNDHDKIQLSISYETQKKILKHDKTQVKQYIALQIVTIGVYS